MRCGATTPGPKKLAGVCRRHLQVPFNWNFFNGEPDWCRGGTQGPRDTNPSMVIDRGVLGVSAVGDAAAVTPSSAASPTMHQ